ncbi:twin-arginine translocase TatA/TatE family subunit [Saprospira sp. CCB-QB6]|uniref:Sec-independent protein translocase subunit TatA/TatB n=1 Tax=Saprospira sp. CCB-QB6 TaxID=3023936 RepID=UPI00234A9DF3|nr:twin-arginine translocase TatA/TatE family subunit [Saprospira sp. CCB-QB6]WCL82983.1 twin-arginine translocase TatA/TatE family subunit [Saprospira sp. CCB-QB6]
MNAILLLSFFGPEMIIVLVAILLLFGGKKIPELMRGLGSGIREFNDAKNKVSKELEAGINEEPKENKKEYEKS